MLEGLIQNFKKRIEAEPITLLEAICLSNKDGLLWKEQYFPRNNRNIYSHSKSFTSLMVGIAIDEKMINFDTRLVDVFKDEISLEAYNHFYHVTVKNLLTMSSGINKALLMGNEKKQGIGYPDYLKFMFSQKLECKPGSKFYYSNGDTYLLARIVSKVYNKPFTQLCYDKIFLPLEIGFPIWGCDPMGYCTAASELSLSVEEMNRLGILFLNNGVYKGKRIISEEYVKACSTTQIKTDDNVWGDYSYQFWMVPEGEGYRADGAFGQITIIWPKYNLTISFQRPEDDNIGRVLEILREEVLSKL